MGIKDLKKILIESGELIEVKENNNNFDFIFIDFSTVLYRYMFTSNNKDEFLNRILQFFYRFEKKKCYLFLDSGYIAIKKKIRDKRASSFNKQNNINFKNYITVKFIYMKLTEIINIIQTFMADPTKVNRDQIIELSYYIESFLTNMSLGNLIDLEYQYKFMSKSTVNKIQEQVKLSKSVGFNLTDFLLNVRGEVEKEPEPIINFNKEEIHKFLDKEEILNLYHSVDQDIEFEENENDSDQDSEPETMLGFIRKDKKFNKKSSKGNTQIYSTEDSDHSEYNSDDSYKEQIPSKKKSKRPTSILTNSDDIDDQIKKYIENLNNTTIDIIEKEDIEIDEDDDFEKLIFEEIEKMILNQNLDISFDEFERKLDKKSFKGSYINIEGDITTSDHTVDYKKTINNILKEIELEKNKKLIDKSEIDSNIQSVLDIVSLAKPKFKSDLFLKNPISLLKKCYFNFLKSKEYIKQELKAISFQFIPLSNKLKKMLTKMSQDMLLDKFENFKFFESNGIDAEFYAATILTKYNSIFNGKVKFISTDQDVLLFLSNIEGLGEIFIESKTKVMKLNCNNRSGLISRLVLLFNGGDFNSGINFKKITGFKSLQNIIEDYYPKPKKITVGLLAGLINKIPKDLSDSDMNKEKELITMIDFVQKYSRLDSDCYRNNDIVDAEINWNQMQWAILNILKKESVPNEIFFENNYIYLDKYIGHIIKICKKVKNKELLNSQEKIPFKIKKTENKLIQILEQYNIYLLDPEEYESSVCVSKYFDLYIKKYGFAFSNSGIVLAKELSNDLLHFGYMKKQ